jgi:hypothetical protein
MKKTSSSTSSKPHSSKASLTSDEHGHASLGSIDFDPSKDLHDSISSSSLSGSSFDMNRRLYSSVNSMNFDDAPTSRPGSISGAPFEDDLNFLTKSAGSRQWKNKRFWKTPQRLSAGSPAFSSESQESNRRRRAIRDSLKGIDALEGEPDL